MAQKPWMACYGRQGAEYDRDQFVRDYQDWITVGLIRPSQERWLRCFRQAPPRIRLALREKEQGWGRSVLNPRNWVDATGRRLY